jgi:MSHA biogenesis protein MshJ
MIKSLLDLQEKIDKRVLRERCLIFISAAAVVFMLWNLIVIDPINREVSELRGKIDAAVLQRNSIQTQISTAALALLNDPNKSKNEQIAQLQVDINQAQDKLKNASQSLIQAEQLPQVLQEVLQKTTQLSLISVVTLPAHEIPIELLGMDSAVSPAPKSHQVGVYEHAVELKVAGNYFQVLEWLKALEALPWRFYWQSLDYKVKEYPRSEIKLRVYTLSTEAGLLGV